MASCLSSLSAVSASTNFFIVTKKHVDGQDVLKNFPSRMTQGLI